MSADRVTTLELRAIERILGMGSGYLLDFTDRQFRDFFTEYDVDIESKRYQSDGTSKAKRFRAFLKLTPPPITGRVLAGLLAHRATMPAVEVIAEDLGTYRVVTQRLGGDASRVSLDVRPALDLSEDRLLQRQVDPSIIRSLPLDAVLAELLVKRMEEARNCLGVNAYLSAVILAGSVLEGLCLGCGLCIPAEVNRGFTEKYGRPAKPFHEWKLAEWIEVLGHLGAFTPNVAKFSHGLREFRNYVHPSEQLACKFSPDERTARIGVQIVWFAAEDLGKALIPRSSGGPR